MSKPYDGSDSMYDLETYMGRVKHNFRLFGPL